MDSLHPKLKNHYVAINCKAIQIIGHRKALKRQKIPQSSWLRKETLDIKILILSENGVKNYTIYQKNEWISREKKKAEPAQPV